MTARIVITCDAVHPERTPPQCRAFLATHTTTKSMAFWEAGKNGWDVTTEDGRDICPSCRS